MFTVKYWKFVVLLFHNQILGIHEKGNLLVHVKNKMFYDLIIIKY